MHTYLQSFRTLPLLCRFVGTYLCTDERLSEPEQRVTAILTGNRKMEDQAS